MCRYFCCYSVCIFGLVSQSFYSVLLLVGLDILCGSSIRLDRLGRWLVLGLNLVRFALSLSMDSLWPEWFAIVKNYFEF